MGNGLHFFFSLALLGRKGITRLYEQHHKI